MIFVNFKTYRAGTGSQALRLAKICQKVAKKTSIKIIPLVQAADLVRFSKEGFEVWTQGVDNIGYGAHSGWILPESVKAAGAKGVMLNHSEKKLSIPVTSSLVKRCSVLGLKTLVCAESVKEAEKTVSFGPNFLAYEPPELIGSRTDSVATAKPEIIKKFVEKIKIIPVLVGAGINSALDVKASLDLGAKGILVSSGVVLADDPQKILTALAGGFKR